MEEKILNVELINKLINKEKLFKVGEKEEFLYKNSNQNSWNLTLIRDENIYSPFIFALEGRKIGTNETWSRRYTGIKEALLHIVNDFNENINIKNNYSDIKEYLNKKTEVTELRKNKLRNDYMMLKRLRSECDCYLRTGDVYDLYYRAVGSQIEEMERIYNSFLEEEKPEWINLEYIKNYEEKMIEVLAKSEEEEI